jgi:hypothetical protein
MQNLLRGGVLRHSFIMAVSKQQCRTLKIVLSRVEIYYEVEYITLGSSSCDLTLDIYSSDPL